MRHNKKIKIAVFPIAGMGTRFLPITKTISKEMLNILDRPLLDYAVQEAKAAGIETFIFVTNKENTKPVDYFSKNTKLESFLKKKNKIDLLNEIKKLNIKKKNMKIIFQDKPSGLADAILRTEKYVKKEDFCVILPDDLIIGSNCTQELINVYNKKNERLFSKLAMITTDGEIITIEGKDIIDNADMFKRAPLPSYLSWVLPLLKIGSKFSSIDPHYTRFESDLRLSIDDTTFQGHGVLEIMDLK